MRQIKFRAWSIKDNKYYSILTHIHYLITGQIKYVKWCTSEIDDGILRNDGDCVGGEDEFILEQFTGLLDKNGKECFENDRVENALTGHQGFVGFQYGGYCVEDENGKFVGSLGAFGMDGFVILGNRYEHKN